MYPKASGTGIVANALMHEICKMAGIHDVGIKVHGSRNARNAGAPPFTFFFCSRSMTSAVCRGVCGQRFARACPASPPTCLNSSPPPPRRAPLESPASTTTDASPHPPCPLPPGRPAVKCVFQAFDKMRTEEERLAAAAGGVLVKMPPGRYSTLRL